MTLRDATSADAGAIAAIWNREIRDGVSTFNTVEKELGALKAAIASDAVYVVAELDGEVVGFATFGPFRGGPGYVHTMEHTIYLDEAARGKGFGRKLMAALEVAAKARGVHVLVAGVGGENSAGIAFHKAMGFVEVGRMPEVGRKFERWMDLVLLQKRL
ncbi:MAG: N-acetyltransferase [Shimia sp.]|uniref:GNAT family N-acetyltransferase n=1 Tax=Shimia sp. TaxID=1954381 RepID=UPI001B12BD44|nr:GNAT family N-acetyltransferase [Shimia sp.]MBO6898321.1 N-acetyltransferase [Shimia sp.]